MCTNSEIEGTRENEKGLDMAVRKSDPQRATNNFVLVLVSRLREVEKHVRKWI